MNKTISNPQQEVKSYQPRYKILYCTLALLVTIIFMRLWYLQIIYGQEFRKYSEKNRIKKTTIPASRGFIFDRKKRVLVENRPDYAVIISPQYAKKLKETSTAIAPILDMEDKKIIEMVRRGRRLNGPFRDVRIKEGLTHDEIFKIRQLRLNHPGLDITQVIVRHYPLNENGAQLFGYVGEISKQQIEQYNKKYKNEIPFKQGDIIGKNGLEKIWEQKIRGKDGIELVEVDARGRKTYSSGVGPFHLERQDPNSGSSLVLTIDREIQEAAYRAMLRNDKVGPRIGSAVVMKSNGEILAWVVTPSFNPNEFTNGISKEVWSKLVSNPFYPLRNKVIQDHYSPGSVFKPFVALAALQENIVEENTKVFSPGSIVYGRRTYHDARRSGHGHINIVTALAHSSNVFFYKLGMQLGIDRMAKYAKLFGFGRKVGIQLFHETPGLMPTTQWKLKNRGEPWQPGENLSHAIGQGFVLATTLQLVHAFNTIAMEGVSYKPFLVKKNIGFDGKETIINQPEFVDNITQAKEGRAFIERAHFQTIKKGLRQVFLGSHGTARWYEVHGLNMAGKTGTVQTMSFSSKELYKKCLERPLQQRYHGWFVGFAPVEAPEVTVAVFAQHGCSGSGGGAPVFRDIVRSYFNIYNPALLDAKKNSSFQKPVRKQTTRKSNLKITKSGGGLSYGN